MGERTRALVREEVIRLSGNVRGQRVLGLGFATPYLRFALDKAERVLAFMPARQGAGGRGAAAAGDLGSHRQYALRRRPSL